MNYTNIHNILRVLILLGFPLAGLISSILGLGDSQITIAFRILVCVISIICISTSRKNNSFENAEPLLFIFFIFYALRLFVDWQILLIDESDKAMLFFLFVVSLPVIASTSQVLDSDGDKEMAILCALTGSFFCILVIASKFLGLSYNRYEMYNIQDERLGFTSLNSISLGYAGYISFISTLVVALKYSQGYMKTIWYGCSLIGLVVVILSNSRSPAIASVLSIILILSSNSDRLIILTIIGVIFITIMQAMFSDEISHVLDRLFKDGSFAHDEAREYLRGLALEAFISNPLFGAFHIDPSVGKGNYPHNIFFDVAMSLGLIGLIPFITILIKSIRNYIHFFSKDYPFLSIILIGLFIQTNTSGTIWGHDSFFMVLSVSLAAKKIHYIYT